MKTVPLPHSDLAVSQLCFGCWGIVTDFHWGQRDTEHVTAALHAALDAGINFFDTAAAYGDGASEQLLGKVVANRRDQVVIATKVLPAMMTPAQIPLACEQSLRRLGTDYIDLYQTHWSSRTTPLAECWDAVLRLQAQGKVRHVGVCNLGVGDMATVCAQQTPVTNQLPYSLLWRAIESEIVPQCRQRQIAVLAYSPLMHGLLAGKYRTAAEVPDGRARSRHFTGRRPLARHGEAGCEAATFAALEQIQAIAQSAGRSMSAVALAWCVQQPGVASVIAGASSAEQLRQNVASLAEPLSDEILRQLDEATLPLMQTLGPNPDMWDGSANSRYR